MRTHWIFGLVLLLLCACRGGSGGTALSVQADTLDLRHAEHLKIVTHPGYTVATLRNPWDTTRVLNTYILVGKDSPLPDSLPAGTLVRVPLQRMVVYSSVHNSLFYRLGALKHIAGICGLRYVNLEPIVNECREGRIVDLGDGMNPDVERLVELNPDAIFLSPFENSGGYGRVGKLGVPIIECADYMETSALGRAEWMRFYGLLLGKTEVADSLFRAVEQRYDSLRSLVAEVVKKPTVMCDLKTSATWYTPGGSSTMGRLLADAGAHYVFAHTPNSGSIPYPFEVVFDRGRETDFWLVRYNQARDKTYGELASDFSAYTGFRPYAERRIYGCNTGHVPFYEEVPFGPDALLKDLIKIFHPDLLPEHRLQYYTPLLED